MNLSKKFQESQNALFIIHLAIGDFTYMQNCFLKLKEQYPSLNIDLFIQDIRMTSDESKWPHLQGYILLDWLKQTHIFRNIYHAYSPQAFETAINNLKKEKYDITVTLGDQKSQNYSAIAREIARDKIAIGVKIKTSLFSRHRKSLKLLDILIDDNQDKAIHISQKFAHWFRQLGTSIKDNDLFPKIDIPIEQQDLIDQILSNWLTTQNLTSIIFINIYAKGEERCWPENYALQLIKQLKILSKYKNALFILNCPPEKKNNLSNAISNENMDNIKTFCASNNFFELPALLKRCNLIITVDTSIMHLACVSNAPLISLIRKKKHAKDIRWNPLKSSDNFIISTDKKIDPISTISVKRVLAELEKI